MAEFVVYRHDPQIACYLPRYRGDAQRAMEGLAADRFWARYIHDHEYDPGWREWAAGVLAADPDWVNGRHRRCTCDEYPH